MLSIDMHKNELSSSLVSYEDDQKAAEDTNYSPLMMRRKSTKPSTRISINSRILQKSLDKNIK